MIKDKTAKSFEPRYKGNYRVVKVHGNNVEIRDYRGNISTLEDLPVIDKLTVYDDIKVFPELYDTNMIVERVTAEADLIERQLK